MFCLNTHQSHMSRVIIELPSESLHSISLRVFYHLYPVPKLDDAYDNDFDTEAATTLSVSEGISTELHHEIPLPISGIEPQGHNAPTGQMGHSHHKHDAGAVHEHYFMLIKIRICNHVFFTVNKLVIHCNQLTAFMWIIILRRFVDFFWVSYSLILFCIFYVLS